jgi:hypothetical protein
MKRFEIILCVIILSIYTISCDDDFSEEDLLNKQYELAKQRADEERAYQDSLQNANQNYQDSVSNSNIAALNQAGRMLNYTVTVTVDDIPIEGVTVSATNTGSTTSVDTDANGNAEFADIMLGGHAISISSPDHLDVSYLVDFGKPEKGVHYEIIDGVVIPIEVSEASKLELFSLTGLQTATIKGKVEIESDLTNSLPEFPQDITIRANLDASGFAGHHTMLESAAGPAGSIYVAGSFSFTEGDIGAASVDNSTGEYSMVIPATSGGIEVDILYPLIEEDQTLAFQEVNGTGVGAQIGTQPARFGSDIAFAATPVVPGVFATFPAPPAPGRGFNLTNFRTLPRDLDVDGEPSFQIDEFPVEELSGIGSSRIRFRGNPGVGYQTSPSITVDAANLNNGIDAIIEAFLTWKFDSILVTDEGSGFTAGETVSVFVDVEDDNSVLTPIDVINITADGDGTLPLNDIILDQGWNINFFVQSFIVRFVGDVSTNTSGTGTLIRSGKVRIFDVPEDGEGYNDIPTIAISGGNPTTPATLVIEEMAFEYSCDLVNSGITQGYVVLPQVLFEYEDIPGSISTTSAAFVATLDDDGFSENFSGIAALEDGLAISAGNLVFDDDSFFDAEIIEIGGINRFSFSEPSAIIIEPVHEQASADITLNADGEITGLANIVAGSGYTSPFDITISALSGLTGAGAAIDLTNFTTTQRTGEVLWNGDITIINSGAGYTNDVNIPGQAFSGALTITVRNGETKIINVNYGTGERVEKVN